MVKYVSDNKHGFSERPHYEPRELDTIFERIVSDFLRRKHGKVSFPLDTEDLKTMIEQDVSDLDQYADLTKYGAGVEGLTEFPRQGKPRVFISEKVHEQENRLRTTLTHEYGHVRLHGYLFAAEPAGRLNLGANQKSIAIYCKRDSMISAAKADWLEWQAGYACGAILMPRTHMVSAVSTFQRERGTYGATPADSKDGRAMIELVAAAFGVSRDAARVRLSILGFLGSKVAVGSLFP